jgi:hypothetical protein
MVSFHDEDLLSFLELRELSADERQPLRIHLRPEIPQHDNPRVERPERQDEISLGGIYEQMCPARLVSWL